MAEGYNWVYVKVCDYCMFKRERVIDNGERKHVRKIETY